MVSLGPDWPQKASKGKKMPASDGSAYRFELLRYVPNVVAGEAFNVGVLLYDSGGRLLDARFAQEFRRLRCHPLADLDYLAALRNEFEEKRLMGEDFSAYVSELKRNLSNSLQVSDASAFRGDDVVTEVERLFSSYVATPVPAARPADEEPQPGTRRALRRHMDEVFERYQLFANGDRLQRDVKVHYGSARLQFSFDYAYQPERSMRYVHGLALHEDINAAAKLCFVYERLRAREHMAGLTVVLDQGVPQDVRDLLATSQIASWESPRLEDLALQIRGELGL
jgi:hypothetical protein